jgi:ABC-2 type transport system permease protein
VPIHELGYRGWQGRTVPEAGRFWVITETGVRLAWQIRWLRRMLALAWLPALYMAVGLVVYERLMATPGVAYTPLGDMLPGFPLVPDRHIVWSWVLCAFFRYPQGVLLVLVGGLVAPPLIAQDARSKAFLLYFSRPITRTEYVLGKMAVVWTYLLLITAAPALFLYFVGVLLSPDLSAVSTTWDVPLRVFAASAVVILPVTTMALAISSLCTETRYAAFAWFALWAVGWVSFTTLTDFHGQALNEHWSLISLYHTLGRVQSWVFGQKLLFSNVLAELVELAALTVLSLVVLFRRVSSPMRV